MFGVDSVVISSFQVDFGLRTRWPEYTYIYLYEMFYKAEVLKNDHNFFRPVSQLKTSVIVWYLLNPVPPSQSVSHLTASQAKSIWGLTDDELESNYHESDRGELSFLYKPVPEIAVSLNWAAVPVTTTQVIHLKNRQTPQCDVHHTKVHVVCSHHLIHIQALYDIVSILVAVLTTCCLVVLNITHFVTSRSYVAGNRERVRF